MHHRNSKHRQNTYRYYYHVKEKHAVKFGHNLSTKEFLGKQNVCVSTRISKVHFITDLSVACRVILDCFMQQGPISRLHHNQLYAKPWKNSNKKWDTQILWGLACMHNLSELYSHKKYLYPSNVKIYTDQYIMLYILNIYLSSNLSCVSRSIFAIFIGNVLCKLKV